MASGYRVEDKEWRGIKWDSRFHSPAIVARKWGRSLAVVLKIKASNSYAQYCGMVAAEHPPQKKNTLANRVEALEILLEGLKEEIERLKTAKALELSHDCD